MAGKSKKPEDPEDCASRIAKQCEIARQLNDLNELMAKLPNKPVDQVEEASVSSPVLDVDVTQKMSGGLGANQTAAGASTMSDEKDNSRDESRQADEETKKSNDDSEIIEPPPLDKEKEKLQPFRVIRNDETSAYAISRLSPKLHEMAIVGLKEMREEKAAADKAAKWAWDGIADDENHIEICGPTKSGKTTLMFLLAVASANLDRPVKIFGRTVVPIERGRLVLLVEEENSPRSCIDKLMAACEMLGINPEPTLNRIVLLARTGFHPTSDAAGDVKADAANGVFGRVFLDSRARIFFKSKSNSEEDQALAARWITDLINRGAGSVWVVSHTRKGRADELDDVSGSQQRAATPDVIIFVTSKSARSGKVLSNQVVFKKIRDDRSDAHPASVTTVIHHNGTRWGLEYREISDDEIEDGTSSMPLRDLILKLIDAEVGGAAFYTLRVKTNVGVKILQGELDALVATKVLVTCKKQWKGRTIAKAYRRRTKADFDSFDELIPQRPDESTEDENDDDE